MKLRFLGGVAEVGRLGMLLEEGGARLLFDYGLAPSDPPKYPEPCPPVDMAFLSHSHLDHCGMLPQVAGKHAPPMAMTKPTWLMAELLQHDSLKVAKAEGYPTPYTSADIRTLEDSLALTSYRDTLPIGGMEVKFHSAGHIPGSTMFEVRGERTLLFTGDMNTADTGLVWGAHPVKCDVLVIEGTYSGRDHPDRNDTRKRFVERCIEVADSGGIVLCPAFAVGRTQEIMMLLADSGLEVWVDGMGREVTHRLLECPPFLRDHGRLQRALRAVKFVHSNHGRRLAMEGDVIVSTSGMLEGGPALGYLEQMHDQGRNAVFFSGFQVPGTNGRRLMEEGIVNIQGVDERVRCAVERFDFSAHAGHSELLQFAKATGAGDVVIMHSDNRGPLAQALAEMGLRVHLPETNDDLFPGGAPQHT
ncbi:MAG: MBL fold metallo-hydrolase [Halobacteriales archaeon]|nr:MBL fold metallo-hydrolase [Halobacteriales archaeon]